MTIEAVLALAATQDPADITTTAIAARMGLSQGAVFRHFPTKDAIWQAVMEWVAEQLLSRIERVAESVVSPMAALEAVFAAHVAFALENPGVPRMLFGELQRTDHTPAKEAVLGLLQGYGQLLRQLIERGKALGEIDPAIVTPAAASMFIGSIQGLIMQALLAGDLNLMRLTAPDAFALYRRAIRKCA